MSRFLVDTLADLICVGQIGAPHGLKGGVRVISHTQDPRSLFSFSSFLSAQGEAILEVDQQVAQESGRVFVVLFKEVTSRTQAELLKGQKLYIHRHQLPLLAQDTFYHQDLVGLKVLLESGHLYGHVKAVENFGAGDLLEIMPEGKRESLLLPFRLPEVLEVNLSEGSICVSLGEWGLSS